MKYLILLLSLNLIVSCSKQNDGLAPGLPFLNNGNSGTIPAGTKTCLDLLRVGHTASDIYTVSTNPVGMQTMYCDMSTDGGGWTLTARWTGSDLHDWTGADVCARSGKIRTQTNDVTHRPVLDDNTIDGFGSHCLVKPGNATFISQYGSWFKFGLDTFNLSTCTAAVTYEKGGVIPTCTSDGLWGNEATGAPNPFNLLPNDGLALCGGPGVCATATCVATHVWGNGCHYDLTHTHEIYRR